MYNLCSILFQESVVRTIYTYLCTQISTHVQYNNKSHQKQNAMKKESENMLNVNQLHFDQVREFSHDKIHLFLSVYCSLNVIIVCIFKI